MFLNLQLEVMERFTATEQHFRESRRFKGDPSQTAKGLVFVQVYAIHEYTVQNVVRLATDAIVAHSHAYVDLRPSLLAMFLDPELSSLRDCGSDRVWESRLKLFDRASSKDSIPSINSLPFDGTHFRHTHLNLILRVFGVSRKLTLRRRHLYRIDEVVNNRNSIAHGGETAENVGRRYSRGDIVQIIIQMRSICLRLISIISEHCDNPSKHLA